MGIESCCIERQQTVKFKRASLPVKNPRPDLSFAESPVKTLNATESAS
jgi:hypothetical protein